MAAASQVITNSPRLPLSAVKAITDSANWSARIPHVFLTQTQAFHPSTHVKALCPSSKHWHAHTRWNTAHLCMHIQVLMPFVGESSVLLAYLLVPMQMMGGVSP